MAGDWIAVEHSTLEKEEVFQIAESVGIDPDAVIGKLLKLWVWVDQQHTKCNDVTVTEFLVDHKTGVTGFAKALSEVGKKDGKPGWASLKSGKITLHNLDRLNGQTAKDRMMTAKRVKSWRNKKQTQSNDITVTDSETGNGDVSDLQRSERPRQQQSQSNQKEEKENSIKEKGEKVITGDGLSDCGLTDDDLKFRKNGEDQESDPRNQTPGGNTTEVENSNAGVAPVEKRPKPQEENTAREAARPPAGLSVKNGGGAAATGKHRGYPELSIDEIQCIERAGIELTPRMKTMYRKAKAKLGELDFSEECHILKSRCLEGKVDNPPAYFSTLLANAIEATVAAD